MRIVASVAIIAVFTVSAIAEPVSVMVSGIGRLSCASWLVNPSSEAEGNAWILGFWSGNNYSAASARQNGAVGATTDALGIIGEVKKRCTENPANTLITEVVGLYLEFQRAGK